MSWSVVFMRTVLADAVLGAGVAGVMGAVIAPESVMMPFVAAAWLAVAGGFGGGAFGLVDGWLRAMVVTFLRPRMRVVRLVAALSYAPAGAFLGSVGGRWPAAVGCALLAGAIGAFVGPLTAYGVRLGPAQRWWWRSCLILLATVVVAGALAGLGVGLATYWPTAVFALMEGASLGATCGIVAVVLLTLGWLPFLRPDVP